MVCNFRTSKTLYRAHFGLIAFQSEQWSQTCRWLSELLSGSLLSALQGILHEPNYNQGAKSLDLLWFSSIHPFTALKWNICPFWDGIVIPSSLSQNWIPLPTPCLNVALNNGVRACIVWINIENGEQGKSLINMPEWSNTFGPDCRS